MGWAGGDVRGRDRTGEWRKRLRRERGRTWVGRIDISRIG